MDEEVSIFSFIADIIPTKDRMQGSRVVEDFESKENEGKKEQSEQIKEQEDEQWDLDDIFLPKEDTGVVTPLKKKRNIKYLSPILEGSNESRDNTPSKTIIVPEIETTPKKKLKIFLAKNSIKK